MSTANILKKGLVFVSFFSAAQMAAAEGFDSAREADAYLNAQFGRAHLEHMQRQVIANFSPQLVDDWFENAVVAEETLDAIDAASAHGIDILLEGILESGISDVLLAVIDDEEAVELAQALYRPNVVSVIALAETSQRAEWDDLAETLSARFGIEAPDLTPLAQVSSISIAN